MAITDLAGFNFNAGGVGSTAKGFFTTQTLFTAFAWVLAIGVIALCIYIIFQTFNKWAKGTVYELSHNGTLEYKEGTIKRMVDKKSKTEYFVFMKGMMFGKKEEIPREVAIERHIFKNKYICPMIRLEDGKLRSMRIVTSYQNPSTGEYVPYARPVDNNLVDHIWSSVKQDVSKYTLTSKLEKLAPYAMFTIVAMMSIMMWYVTNGR